MSEILEIWKTKDAGIRSFLKTYPQLLDMLNGLIVVAKVPISAAYDSDLTSEQAFLLQLWVAIYKYQEDSLFLIMSKRFDSGFALLRMAAELARDIVRMSEDNVNYEMWQKKNELNREECYKQTFRFNQKNQIERFVFKQYNLFSNWGVHGHLTAISQREHVGETDDGRFAQIAIPEEAVVRNIGLWMASYLPLHQMCQKVFENAISRHSPEALTMLSKMIVVSGDVIKITCKYGRGRKQ